MFRLVFAALTAAVALVSVTTIASAADIGPLAMPRSWTGAGPASAVKWDGWYVGATVGYGFGGRAENSTTVGNTTFDNGITTGGAMTYGVQGGFNHMLTPSILIGIEADFNGGSIKGETTQNFGFGFSQKTVASLDWWGTLRPRLGYVVTPDLLVFVTGGLAYGSVRTDMTQYCPAQCGWQSQKAMSIGYALGGGAEWMFAPNWSAKFEYLYLDFGTQTTDIRAGAFALKNNTGLHTHVARIGINYHF